MENSITTLAAKKDFGRIYRCPRGCVHVQVGPVSVAFLLDEYMDFVDLVHTSAANFELVRGEHDVV